MTQELDDLLSTMLAEVKEHKKRGGKAKAGKKKPQLQIEEIRTATRTAPGLATMKNPWKDEALVQIMTLTHCRKCGNEGTAWEPFIFLQRTRKVRGNLETLLTRIETCAYEDLYRQYPKRIEVRNVESCSCPTCFPDYFTAPKNTTTGVQGELHFTLNEKLKGVKN